MVAWGFGFGVDEDGMWWMDGWMDAEFVGEGGKRGRKGRKLMMIRPQRYFPLLLVLCFEREIPIILYYTVPQRTL